MRVKIINEGGFVKIGEGVSLTGGWEHKETGKV